MKEERSENRRIEREKKSPCCADRKYREGREEERKRERERGKEGKRGPDWTFLPRTGPRQNVIMLIRDWFENVKCTRHSTAGYHEPPSIGFLSLSFSLRRSLLSPSLHLALLLSLLHFEHRYLWNLLHRAPATFHSARSHLVLSRRDPGDQKRFNLRYHRWRAKPRFVSGLRWIRHM